MYRCDNSVTGCIQVTVSRIAGDWDIMCSSTNSCLNVNASRCNDDLSVACNRVNEGLHVNTHRISKGLKLETIKIGSELKVCCGIVCDLSKDFYLRVSPDVVWLTPDMISGEFDIYSNVIWEIN